MRFFKRKQKAPVSFEEILLDASNLPAFNTHRLEGRMELPLPRHNIFAVGLTFSLVAAIFFFQLFKLQVIEGATMAERSEYNSLDRALVIAERGPIYDRFGELIAWNERDVSARHDFPIRAYTQRAGLGQLIGFVSYPKKDRAGFYFRTEYLGRSGLEEAYNDHLAGKNGTQLVEVNAHGEVISNHTVAAPTSGDAITLSIDAELSEAMHNLIATTSLQNGFRSGAGAIINIHTGELIAMTSFPSFNPKVMADGTDEDLISAYHNDERLPFLNKVVAGVYTPGSIVKPFVAYGALAENLISPDKIIVSRGSIIIPNPYSPNNPAIFRDWRDSLGAMTIREGIAFSSNVFMMSIGGGYENQRGLGITKLNEYFRLFGLGSTTGIVLSGEQAGVIPTPEWKQSVFNDDWRLGDTYLMSIGQFGFQTTAIQMLRAYAALANGGTLITPHLLKNEVGEQRSIGLDAADLKVVREGMRAAVIQAGGTARSLERKDVAIAAKSGTAELGTGKATVNSWIAGYFPYETPIYAFILFMENGPRANTVGASSVMGKVFNWMGEHRPEYFSATTSPAQ